MPAFAASLHAKIDDVECHEAKATEGGEHGARDIHPGHGGRGIVLVGKNEMACRDVGEAKNKDESGNIGVMLPNSMNDRPGSDYDSDRDEPKLCRWAPYEAEANDGHESQGESGQNAMDSANRARHRPDLVQVDLSLHSLL
jgi:hypothetical protein